jgi:hypothetical protein
MVEVKVLKRMSWLLAMGWALVVVAPAYGQSAELQKLKEKREAVRERAAQEAKQAAAKAAEQAEADKKAADKKAADEAVKAEADKKADKAEEKADDKADKAEEKADDKADKAEEAATDDAELLALRKTREERRAQSLKALEKRWGSLAKKDDAQAELKLHARRIAFLQRIRSFAESKKEVALLKKVDEALTKEETRHAAAMNVVRYPSAGVKEAAVKEKPGGKPGEAPEPAKDKNATKEEAK